MGAARTSALGLSPGRLVVSVHEGHPWSGNGPPCPLPVPALSLAGAGQAQGPNRQPVGASETQACVTGASGGPRGQTLYLWSAPSKHPHGLSGCLSEHVNGKISQSRGALNITNPWELRLAA